MSYELDFTSERDFAISHVRQKYPFGLLVSTRLKEREVDLPFYFGTVPRERGFKEWRFETLDDRKTFAGLYPSCVLGEIPVVEAR
jgi:hypothetical protein